MTSHSRAESKADDTIAELCRVTRVGGYVIFSMRTIRGVVDAVTHSGCKGKAEKTSEEF